MSGCHNFFSFHKRKEKGLSKGKLAPKKVQNLATRVRNAEPLSNCDDSEKIWWDKNSE